MRNLIKSVALIAGGVVGGFALAHFANRTEQGQVFFANVNEFVDDVREAIQQGYEARTEAIYAAIGHNERSESN